MKKLTWYNFVYIFYLTICDAWIYNAERENSLELDRDQQL